jgi:hypothetical protein
MDQKPKIDSWCLYSLHPDVKEAFSTEILCLRLVFTGDILGRLEEQRRGGKSNRDLIWSSFESFREEWEKVGEIIIQVLKREGIDKIRWNDKPFGEICINDFVHTKYRRGDLKFGHDKDTKCREKCECCRYIVRQNCEERGSSDTSGSDDDDEDSDDSDRGSGSDDNNDE